MSIDALERRRIDVDSAYAKKLQDCEEKVEALLGFTQQMLGIEGVEAVAFLISKMPHTGPTLSMEVLTPFEPADKSTVTLTEITQADSELARRLHRVLPTSMRFVNTHGSNVDSLAPRLYRRWNEDPTLNLVAFVVFDRNNQ